MPQLSSDGQTNAHAAADPGSGCPPPAAPPWRAGALLARYAVLLPLVAAATGLAWAQHGRPTLGIDDANIFFVYAEHLARGAGFVYNVGGERVEGFTSLLWVVVCAPLFHVWARPETAVLVLAVALLTATHAVVTVWIDAVDARRRRWLPGPWAAAYLVLVFLSPAYVTWMTVTLMDSGLWGFIVAGLTISVLGGRPDRRSPRATAVLLAAAVLTRPEALLLGPVMIAALWARRGWSTGRWGWNGVQTPLAMYLAVAAGLTAFRIAYFGFPFPNTYYAKVSPSWRYNLAHGWSYLAEYMWATPVALLGGVLAAALVALLIARTARSAIAGRSTTPWHVELVLLALVSLSLLVLPVIGGGDHFGWWRFYQPAYPVLALLLVCFARATTVALHARGVSTPVRGALTLALAAAVIATAARDDGWLGAGRPLWREFELARAGYSAGAIWHEMFAPRGALPSLGVLVAGGIKRSYPGKVVDLLGLNDTAMGHSPGDRQGDRNHAAFDAEVFFAHMPDVVVPDVAREGITLGVNAEATGGYHVTLLKGLPGLARFQAEYVYLWLHGRDVAAQIRGYVRRDLAADLMRDPRFEVSTTGPTARRP